MQSYARALRSAANACDPCFGACRPVVCKTGCLRSGDIRYRDLLGISGTNKRRKDREVLIRPMTAQFCQYIETLAWVRGHLDASTFECFKAAVAHGIAREVAFEIAANRIRSAASRIPKGKLERQWKGAIRWVAKNGGTVSAQTVELSHTSYGPDIDYGRVDDIVRAEFGLYDLWEQSPVRFNDDCSHTEEIVDVIFPGNPWLCTGIGKHDFWTRQREALRGELAHKEFIVPQPMLAQSGVTLEGHLSEHSLSNTGPRQHYVVEFDFREEDKAGQQTHWAKLIRGWAERGISVVDASAALLDHFSGFAPLGLVVHSAGKSCHGWFPTRGATPQQIEAFRHEAFVLGADRALFRNNSQFVRMPDGVRSANGRRKTKRSGNARRQTTYFFDPKVFSHANRES